MYQIDNMLLQPVRTVLTGEVNDVFVCRDVASRAGNLYTLVAVRDNATAKRLLSILENCAQSVAGAEQDYVRSFQDNGTLNVVFRYKPERRLKSFAPGQLTTTVLIESAGANLAEAYMTSTLPPQVLLLTLNDDCVNLNEDGTVYINEFLDLKELDDTADEKKCVNRAASIISSLYGVIPPRKRKKIKSVALLGKKAEKEAYSTFRELWHDMRLTGLAKKKQSIIKRIKAFFSEHGHTFFRILLVLCVLLAITAVVLLISHFLFGNALYLFRRNYALDYIGTESLR